jgi:YHS domain-containing protein
MINRILFVAALFLVSSCNNGESTASVTLPGATESTTTAAQPVLAANIDPVCEMTYDTSWTESTVYMNDTVHFCSENCKTAFVAHPEKYKK